MCLTDWTILYFYFILLYVYFCGICGSIAQKPIKAIGYFTETSECTTFSRCITINILTSQIG